MAKVRKAASSKKFFLGTGLLFGVMAFFATASLAGLRSDTRNLERQASRLDFEIDRVSEKLRNAERDLVALAAPLGVYSVAAQNLGMQCASLAGVVHLEDQADRSVMSASLPSR